MTEKVVVANKKVYWSVLLYHNSLFGHFLCASQARFWHDHQLFEFLQFATLWLLAECFIVICRVPQNAIITFTNSHTQLESTKEAQRLMSHNFHNEQWIHEKESHGHTSILSCGTGYDQCLQLCLLPVCFKVTYTSKTSNMELVLLISLQVLQSKRTYCMYTFQQSSSWLFDLSKLWASELNIYILDCLMGYNSSQFDTWTQFCTQ